MNWNKQGSLISKKLFEEFLGKCDFTYFPERVQSDKGKREFVEKLFSRATTLIEEHEGQIAGMVCLYCNDHNSKEAFISFVGVHSEYQGKGIAKRLIRKAIEHAEMKQFYTIKLEVHKNNTAAIKLYQFFQFKESSRNDPFIQMKFVTNE